MLDDSAALAVIADAGLGRGRVLCNFDKGDAGRRQEIDRNTRFRNVRARDSKQGTGSIR